MKWGLALGVLAACGNGAVTADELMQACVKLRACGDLPVRDCSAAISDHESRVSAWRPHQVRCMVEASIDCDELFGCIGMEAPRPCTPDGTLCDGTKLLSCVDGVAQVIDCDGGLFYAPGSFCIGTRCGQWTCTPTTTAIETCNGTRLETCGTDGVFTVFDCADIRAACTMNGARAFCDYPTPLDCGALFDGGKRSTLLPGCVFAEVCVDPNAICTGDLVSGCVHGMPVTFDCKAHGYAGCVDGGCVF